ncbi:MAG TPA: D-glycero-beta-D-manno-heptose-7-phosphate kinase [Candidatus Cloacimonadota bacterium]|nr:D-glycero-beta-D-manno-heptose-7-phosphate kinase [Candidatus Cloacimonadota bacterium]HQH50569.1 D-glycero-beta-D-manno-heptose-7-phosphate kinase [Candidatus Cloacimonadota bacterium]
MIRELLAKFGKQRVLVLGDIMLDHYIWGKVERISAEAPVPVLEAQREEFRLGGAANAALNVKSLGGDAILLGVTGRDSAAQDLKQLMEHKGLATDGLIADPNRRTTLKTRIVATNQQIVRIDRETKIDLGNEARTAILDRLRKLLPGCQALIIEDYNKGVLTREVISGALELAASLQIPVAVDPKHKNIRQYRGVDIFKPNFRELQDILDMEFESEDAFLDAASQLRGDMQIKNLIVTRGSLGMYVFDGGKQARHLPTAAREVFDVSGAGDTVISALTLAYVSGADIHLAAKVANHAAGVACGIVGTASVGPDELLKSYNEQR